MEIQDLSDSELLVKTRSIAREEQRLALELIEHLIEIDSRKLYASLGYDSLFYYIVKELGYSETTAYERMRAMRLVRRVPEVKEKLETGALSLTTAAQVESYRKQESLSVSETIEFVQQASHKSKREIEKLILTKSPDAIPQEKIRQVSADHQEARIVLDPKLQALLARYQELHGKKQISEILGDLLEAYLEKNDPLRKKTTATVKPCSNSRSRYVSSSVKLLLWKRSQGRCEWKHPITKSRCSSRYRLQFDHYPIPHALGDPSTSENLRLVCPAHNARFAVEVYGRRITSPSPIASA